MVRGLIRVSQCFQCYAPDLLPLNYISLRILAIYVLYYLYYLLALEITSIPLDNFKQTVPNTIETFFHT